MEDRLVKPAVFRAIQADVDFWKTMWYIKNAILEKIAGKRASAVKNGGR
nr:hypothetical protein [uncultured Oscillibacter sp.]